MNNILSLVIAGITLLFGLWAFIQPHKYAKLLSLIPDKEAGTTEIRSSFGGLILGLGAYVLYSQSSEAFLTLGFAYLGLGVARGLSIFIMDGNCSRQNLFVFIFEIVASGILLFHL